MRLPGVPCASHRWHVPGDFLWSSGKPTGHLAEIARGMEVHKKDLIAGFVGRSAM